MRTMSLTMRRAMFKQETGEDPVVFLTITHPNLSAPIYLSSDPTTRISETPLQYVTNSRGRQYLFFPFAIVLPDDVAERAPAAQIQLENVSRKLVELIRSVSGAPGVTIELALVSSPDVIEAVWPNFQMKAAPYNANVMTIELAIDALTEVAFPADSFDPSGFPGIF